jgi:hypothetical protein
MGYFLFRPRFYVSTLSLPSYVPVSFCWPYSLFCEQQQTAVLKHLRFGLTESPNIFSCVRRTSAAVASGSRRQVSVSEIRNKKGGYTLAKDDAAP